MDIDDELLLHKDLNEWTERKYIIWKAIPISLSYLLQNILPFISVFALGHLGQTELAVATLSIMCYHFTFVALIYGAATALDTLCSQAYTSGDVKMVGIFLQRATIIQLLGFIPIACIWWESEQILILMGQSPAISSKTCSYLRYLLIGAPAFLLFENLRRYLQAQGIMKASTYVLVICCIIDICLNYLLILYQPLSLGFIGAPIATSITNWLMFSFLVIYTKFINGYQAWGGWSRAAFYGWKQIFTLAIPGILMVCSELWTSEFISFLTGYLGELPLASQGILSVLVTLLYQSPFGLSVSASNRVGNLLGAGLVEKAKMTSKLTMQFAIILALFEAIILIVFKDYWGYIFISKDDVVKYTSNVIPLISIFEISDGLNVVGQGILRGQGRQNIGALINAPGYVVLGLPVSIFTAFILRYGLLGLWFGSTASSIIVCIILLIILWRTDWQQQLEECKKRMKEGKDKLESMISDVPDF
ncbi:mate-domain-containing protein [Gigaspora rosea]|uniref:Mate-domain-containing protein n=1 Tax=Gigaspora rosea TaxID=44941 RepID=A0A397UMB2_9GLOM|nr:mate-domain-containing protein [Gigaspora rosea]